MTFVFFSEPTFETWDWTNPEVQGIGGSETSHIEMARRLAERGHEVISYAPTPFLHKTGPAGVSWRHSETAQFYDSPDVWVIYRAPHAVDLIPERPGQQIWLICQDVDYPKTLTIERAQRFTRIVALCQEHARFLKARYPQVADRIFVSSNGIKSDLIDRLMRNRPPRNPRRLMYASSPDRGLEFLLWIFPRCKEIIEDLELHVFYGFDNIEKVLKRVGPKHWIAQNTERIQAMMQQPGVVHHGRKPQAALLTEWMKSGIWCHPSNFTETSCITSMDAQACGAIPLTTPLWAVAENVKHGVFVEGDVRDELVRSRYVLELTRLALDPERQERIREDMMPWALRQFDWERFVDQWEAWAGVRVEEAVA